MSVIAREASEVLAFTSALWKKRVRFAARESSEESSSTSSSTPFKLSGPCHTQAQEQRPKPTLNQFRALVKLWKHGMVDMDAEFVANRYAPNAILSNDGSTFRGRLAIQTYYEQEFFPKHQPKDIKVLYGNVAIYGEQVHDNGIYDITTKSGKFIRCKYTFVYGRDSETGRWRIVHHKTAKVNEIYTTETPIDNHATHVRSVSIDDDEQEEESVTSTTSSEIIPWGAFPFEDGYGEQQQQESSSAVEGRYASHIECETATTEQDQPNRRPSEIDRLVALLTGSNKNNVIVLNVNNNNGDLDTSDDNSIPKRRPSQVDHLVGLLTGTKSVTQNDLILLSLENKKVLEPQEKADSSHMRAQ